MIKDFPSGKIKIDNLGDDLQVVIYPPKDIFSFIIFVFWLVVLLIFSAWILFAITQMLKGEYNKNVFEHAYAVFHIVLSTIGASIAIKKLILDTAGKEIITISRVTIKIGKKALGVEQTKEYHLYLVKNLRVQSGFLNQWIEFGNLRGGRMEFDYKGKTIRFACGIDDSEAAYLLELFKNKFAV